ncbi:hypothetical protein Ccrd_026790, partial [Cynara cardunculus var. scolymus]
MEFDSPLDYAAFQLSPKHSRCELFVSSNGNTEKLASGLVKPFMTHMKVVDEQVAKSVQSIKLEVDKCKNADSWFTKGTLERFVRFVSTPEIVELVITFDAEMSQLEAARRIYSQACTSEPCVIIHIRKELLRAIDVRLTAVKQDLNTACDRAAAAGFNHDVVADLQLFAERFGASRLNEACCKYISLYNKRPELFNNSPKSSFGDQAIRCSYSSDMSIDDDPPTITTEQSSSATAEQSAKPPNTSQPPKSSSSTSLPLRPSSTPATWELTTGKDEIVSENQIVKKEEVGSGVGDEELMAQTATQPSSRRLSVQDRINLFENKQKEVGSGNGGKPAIVKPELRRLSSEVSHSNSAAPPATLKRWSGASDMSIDLSGEKKETDSSLKLPVNKIPTSAKTEVQKNQPDLNDRLSGSSCRGEDMPITKVEKSSGSQLTFSSSVRPEEPVGSNQSTSTLEMMQSWSSLIKSDDDSLEAQLKPHSQIKSFHGGNQDRFGVSNQEEFSSSIVGTSQHGADAGPLESDSKQMTLSAPSKNAADSKYQRGGSGSKFREAVAASQHRGLEIDLLCSQPRCNYLAESEEVDGKGYAPTKKQFGKSGVQKILVQKNVRRDESIYVDGYSNTLPSGKFVEGSGGSMPLEPLVEQAHRSKQLKGNQGLNDELKMKACELEKLFTEHKLRGPGDQPNYARRSKPFDDGTDQATSLPYRKQVAEAVPIQVSVFNSSIPVAEVDGQNHRDALHRSFSEVILSDDSRGKFYESYMKKREERLKEQWGSNKAEKEVKMKAMHDILERSSAEMKAKLSWSADRQDSIFSAHRRTERLRSFNARSAMKREQPLDFGQLEDDEDLSEFSELKLISNGVSRNVQGKNPLPIKNSSTSTPRTPAPRSGGTKVASSSGRRKVQSDNPLVQSVPNLLALRKENTKPYSVVSKAAARSQLRNYARSRSTSEEMPSVKEEKQGRCQSLRKNSPTPPESSECVILTPLKFESEGVHMESKSFVRKNNGIGGNIIAKMKWSVVPEAMKNEEEYDPDVVEDDDNQELDTMKIQDEAVVVDGMINSKSGHGELPATAFPVQDSPGESPMSWNSGIHRHFEVPDNVESWNLNPTEDARMRKKWGSTQKHILVANTCGVQSRKDMTKGFKRLLKFGRKSNNMADWISATTSEGDDDTEDGRDRSSDDLRKSRMGGLPFEGSSSFNESSDFFSDQVWLTKFVSDDSPNTSSKLQTEGGSSFWKLNQ